MLLPRLLIIVAMAFFIVAKAVASQVEFDDKLDALEQMLSSDVVASEVIVQELSQLNDQLSLEQRARFLVLKSIKSLYVSDYRLALKQLESAESLQPSETLLSSIYLYKATAYIPLGQFELVFKEIAKNLSRIERIEDIEIKLNSYLRLVALYYKLGAYEDMRLFAAKAIELDEGQDSKNHCYALLYMAVAHLKLKAIDRASDGFHLSAEYCHKNNTPLIVAMSEKGLGMIEMERNNFAKAESYLLKALSAYEKFKFQLEINHTNALLTQTYLGLGDEAKIAKYADLVLALADDAENIEYKVMVHNALASLYGKQQQFESAYQHLALYQEYGKLLNDEVKTKAQAHQMAKFDSEEKAREIALLNKERELYISLQQVKEREHTNMLLFITLLVGGVFFLAVLVVASLLQKRKYMRMAKIDSLTGIYNRGAGQDLGENSFIQVLSRGGEFGMIMFDLDRFKQVNDTYGHGTGDWALKKVTEVIKGHTRSSDIFARLGGDEFVIMLPFADKDNTLEVAQKCHSAIEAIDTHYSGHDFNLTASFGIAYLDEADLSLDPMMHRADIALYSAKLAGRNRVEVYREGMESGLKTTAIKSRLALDS